MVLDLRPFDDNVSIESIHVKCNVLLSKADDDPGGLVKVSKQMGIFVKILILCISIN